MTTYQNLANSSFFSFNVYANYKASKTQNFNGSITVSKIECNSAVNAAYIRTVITLKPILVVTILLIKKNLPNQIYYVKSTAAQGVSSVTMQTQFGVERNMLKNKIAVTVHAVDPFT